MGQTFQGVETASQIRYVGYYEKIKMKHQGIPPKEQQIQVTKVIITSIKGEKVIAYSFNFFEWQHSFHDGL